jgi:methylated-DNA-[protein]-cysteine S-methyltransferase
VKRARAATGTRRGAKAGTGTGGGTKKTAKSGASAQTIAYGCLATALGVIHIVATAEGLSRIQIGGRPPATCESRTGPIDARRHVTAACAAIRRFFAGDCKSLTRLPLDLSAMSEFQRRIYTALRRLGAGQTCSYGALADLAGKPGAARAVGRAMATNPLPLAIPCHRVLASDGTLGGYGGPRGQDVDLKRRLLQIEGWSA